MAENWRILNISNPANPRACSICCEDYRKNNPVMIYTICKHVVCSQCYSIAGNQKKCQVQGCVNGQYVLSNELTQIAECGTAKQVTEPIVTFNLVASTGSSFCLTYPKELTLGDMVRDLKETKGVVIAAIAVGNKIWRVEEHKNKSLREMGITKGVKVTCTMAFHGGVDSS